MSTGFGYIVGNNAYGVIDDADNQATAGAGRGVLVIRKLLPRDLETITAWARIVVNTIFFIPAHVLDLDLVVVRTHRESKKDEAMVVSAQRQIRT